MTTTIELQQLAEKLPEGVTWGAPLTPEIVQHLAQTPSPKTVQPAEGRQEPVGRVDRCEYVAARNEWRILVWRTTEVPAGTELYTTPPAEVNAELLESLEMALCYVPDDSAYDKEVRKKATSAIAAAQKEQSA